MNNRRTALLVTAMILGLAHGGVLPSEALAGECDNATRDSVSFGARNRDLTYFIKSSSAPSTTWIDRTRDGARSWNDLINNCGFNDVTTYTRIYGGDSSIGWSPGDGFSRIDYGPTSALNACGNQSGILACTYNTPYSEFDIRINPYFSWSTIGNGCGVNRDVWSVAAHEFGHTVALAHVANATEQTMQTNPGEAGQCSARSLGRGDVLGLRDIDGP